MGEGKLVMMLLKQFMWEIMRAKGTSLGVQWFHPWSGHLRFSKGCGQKTKKEWKPRWVVRQERERNERIPEIEGKNQKKWNMDRVWNEEEKDIKVSFLKQYCVLWWYSLKIFECVCKTMTNVPRSKSHQTFPLYQSGVLRLGICEELQQVLTVYRASVTLQCLVYQAWLVL